MDLVCSTAREKAVVGAVAQQQRARPLKSRYDWLIAC